jgi:uncharacterized heparinase superfamily protein
LYVNTVRWLRLSQLAWLIYRRLRPVVNPALVSSESHRANVAITAFAGTPEPSGCELRFLNQSTSADPVNLNWHPADQSRLWRYNLHYFDYLQWQVIPDVYKQAYIDSWLTDNPMGAEDSWEPYTVSLRIVNWIKYFAMNPDTIPAAWQESLINQANWLLSNVEHHILANHLLKNAKALLFAGVWFEGPLGRRFLRTGLDYFLRELDEQFLADGGHFERSPMYHCIALEDCLDVLNLVDADLDLFGKGVRERVQKKTERAMHFLDQVLCADGRIPLFNDAAFDIAVHPADLFEYGQRLFDYQQLSPARQPLRIALPASGYFGYRCGADSFLIDCGEGGPDYQPGHMHCDTLSYELCIDGVRIVSDSGVHGYEHDDTRHYLRSTAAHNTVTLNDAEQSEIWGTFRVARRARPLRPRLSQIEDGKLSFEGSHDGYQRLRQNALHKRRVEIDLAGCWAIKDELTGSGSVEAKSFVHFGPGVRVIQKEDGICELLVNDKMVARLVVDAGCAVRTEPNYVATGFGVRVETESLILSRSGELPLQLGYRLERHGAFT